MAISYNKLWKLLVDRKMSKADLRKAAGIAPNTMTRLRRDEEVTLTVLNKICVLCWAQISVILWSFYQKRKRRDESVFLVSNFAIMSFAEVLIIGIT